MKWIKHDTDASQDAKLQNVLLDYGLEGYGLYWYCIELIAGKVDQDNITFELEHDARIIARNTGSTPQKVEEMMRYFVELGLFESSHGVVTCMKLARRLDKSMTSNPQMRCIIERIRECNSHDPVMIKSALDMTESGKVMQDKIRLEENRKEKKKTKSACVSLDFSCLQMSDDEVEEIKEIRRKAKSPITQRVINTLAKEFDQARKKGWSNDDILSEWSSRGWRSFKAEWVSEKKKESGYKMPDFMIGVK